MIINLTIYPSPSPQNIMVEGVGGVGGLEITFSSFGRKLVLGDAGPLVALLFFEEFPPYKYTLLIKSESVKNIDSYTPSKKNIKEL